MPASCDEYADAIVVVLFLVSDGVLFGRFMGCQSVRAVKQMMP